MLARELCKVYPIFAVAINLLQIVITDAIYGNGNLFLLSSTFWGLVGYGQLPNSNYHLKLSNG